MMGRRSRHSAAPMSTVMQSPKDDSRDENGDVHNNGHADAGFNSEGRPLSARASDRPGGALSGARPRSFSRVKAARACVNSYVEEEEYAIGVHGEESKEPREPAGGHSHGGSYSSTTDLIGSGSALSGNGGGRTARVTSNDGSNLSGMSDQHQPRQRPPSSSTLISKKLLRGGSRGLGSPPAQEDRRGLSRGEHHTSVGTALHALDDSRHGGDAARQQSRSALSALGLSQSSRGANPRRSVGSGPVHSSRMKPVAAASGFDSPTETRGRSASPGTMLPRRGASTNNLEAMVAAQNGGGNFDSALAAGTPMSIGENTPGSRGLSRATSTRSSHGHSRSSGGHGSSGGLGRRGSSSRGLQSNGSTVGTPNPSRKPPRNLREAIRAGDVLAVGAFVRGMSPDEAQVELVKQDREHGSPLMQAAAGKSAQTYRAVLDAIKSRLGVEALEGELQARDLRAWGPLTHAAWSGSADVFRAVVVAIEDHLGREQVAEQLASRAKYGWTPLHAAARGNAEAMGAVMTALVNYIEPDKLKEQLSQSNDKESDLPTPLMFAAASSSLDSRSLSPLLTELLGSMCDIDEARRQRTAVDYSAAYGRLDTLSCLIAYGCEISDQTVTTLLSGDLAVGAAAFNKCIWKGITTARNPLIPAHNVLRAVGRAADRDAKHRQFLLRMQADVDELVQELLNQLPPNMAGFADNNMDTGQGFAAVQWMLEPEMAGKRIPTFTGPLARALETRRLEFFSTNIVLAYVSRKFSRGLPGMFSGASWRMPDMHNPDTKRFVLCLPYGAAPDNIVGAVRMRLFVPFELIQGSALRRTSLLPGLQFNAVGLASRPDAFYEVPSIRMAFDVVTYLSMVALFCFVVKLDSPTHVPAQEWAFYAYMLGTMVNELGEARYLRKLRGQSELWNVVEAILLGLICAAFTARMIALGSNDGREEAFFLAQLFLAIATPLLFSRVLFLAQIDENLGLMVQVLFRMLKEVVRFGVVIGVVLLGFAMAMYALFGGEFEMAEEETTSYSSRGRTDDDTDGQLSFDPYPRFLQSSESVSTMDPATFDISEVYLPSFTSFTESALTLFRAMFGDFDFGEFAGVRYGPAGVGLMVAFLTIMAITLLNLLIAFLTAAHTDVQKHAQAKFHFSRTQIVQHWDRVVEHDVLPAPLNLVHRTLCLLLRVFVSKQRYPKVQMRIGCFLFWLVMGPLGAVIGLAIWLISLPWSIWMLFVGGQAAKEIDRRSERLKYVVTAPGLLIIALLLGFLTIFVGDGSSDGASGRGTSTRSSRRDVHQRGGDFDVAGLMKKLARMGVDDLRRQLKNPLKDTQVLPRDSKLGTTVEHVKLLRDDITSTTGQTMRDHIKASDKVADERAMRLEARLDTLEMSLAKMTTLLEAATKRNTSSSSAIGVSRAAGTGVLPVTSTSGSTVSGSRSMGSQGGSHVSGGE